MVLEGPMGRGASCNFTSFSFEVINVVVVGAQWAPFGAEPKGEGAHQLSALGEGAPEKGGFNPPALWNLADIRSTNHRGTYNGKLQLLDSLSLQAGCIAFTLGCLPQLHQGLQ